MVSYYRPIVTLCLKCKRRAGLSATAGLSCKFESSPSSVAADTSIRLKRLSPQFSRPSIFSTVDFFFDFYASAQRNVAVDIMFFVLFMCSSVHPCVRACVRASVCASRNIVNTVEYLTHFHQTYINDALHFGFK